MMDCAFALSMDGGTEHLPIFFSEPDDFLLLGILKTDMLVYMSLESFLSQLRAYRIAAGLTKSRLAINCGFEKSSISDMDLESWNPTLKRLKTMLAYMKANPVDPRDKK